MLVTAGMCSSAGLSNKVLCREIVVRLKYINIHRFEAYWRGYLLSTSQGAPIQFRTGVTREEIV